MSTYENIKFTKKNVAFNNGYFYMFDESLDMLLKKTDDGEVAFSYPLDSLLESEVVSVEHDGLNFWTLTTPDTTSRVIQRWQIDNFVCKLQQTINYSSSVDHDYSFDAFAVEKYKNEVYGVTHPAGTTVINVDADYRDNIISGMDLILGPNNSGNVEVISIQDVGQGTITLQDQTQYAYEPGDSIRFYNNIWFFNNHDGKDSSTGALYKTNAYSGSYITRYTGGAFKDITACCFEEVNNPFADNPVKLTSLMYIKGSSLLFIDIVPVNNVLKYYGSMLLEIVLNNIVYPVYDMFIHEGELYKLMQTMVYYGAAGSGQGYNYHMSTLTPYITSVSVMPSPGVIPANQVDISTITATVLDQFGQPVAGRLVQFTEDDDVGYINGENPVNTDINGQAVTTYQSGSTAREVTITATVQQA